MWGPVRRLREARALRLKLVLDKKRNDVGEANRLLLAIGEPCHRLARDQRPAIRTFDMAQHARRVAHERDGFAGADEGFDQPDRIRVLGEVPHRPMAAGIEDRVESVLADAVEPRRVGEARLGRLVRLEPAGEISLKFGFIALWVQWRLTALGRGKRDLGSGVEKDVIGRGELFQPEACHSACVAEPVMRGEDDENFHGFLLFREYVRMLGLAKK